jgi:hypothetical protein
VGFRCAFVVIRSEVDRGCPRWDHDGWELTYPLLASGSPSVASGVAWVPAAAELVSSKSMMPSDRDVSGFSNFRSYVRTLHFVVIRSIDNAGG